MTEHKNTNETSQLRQTAVKCRFFAQYLGQKVFHGFSDFEMILQPHHLESSFYNKSKKELSEFTNPNPFLELKPLSKISDKDCILIFNKFFPNAIRYSDDEKIYDIKSSVKSNFLEEVISDKDFIFYTDFMRSKGYALSFMEYSVDDLVSFGWVRLS